MLDALDLDTTEQALYETLVDGPPRTVAEIGMLGFGAEPARQVITALEARGLVSRVPGNPPRFAAVPPDIALEVLFLERERTLKRARAYAEQLTVRFQKAAAGRDPAELVEVVTGRPAIRQRWEQIQRAARYQVRGIDKPPYTVPKNENVSVESELLAAGITYRIIYDTAGLESFHDWRSDIELGINHGEQARVLPNTPTKLNLIDDRLAMIPLQPAPAPIVSMIVVHPSGLLEALDALFEDLWRRSLPLTSPADVASADADQPSADERRLLSLLATGMPDDAIAKHLGLSHRTFQRRLRALLDRLDAATRFQAGLRAARRGWIPD